MKTVRIFIADDHEIVRHGLRRLLESQPGWEICGEASSGREAAERVCLLKPEVAILDYSMPEMNGAEAARRILKGSPRTEIVVLTMHDTEQLLREVLQTGARGYVLKSDAANDLVAAVNTMLQHKRFISPGASGVVVEGFLRGPDIEPGERLTPREGEIVKLLAEGKSNKEVAALLDISIKTVEAHRANIMHKLNLAAFSDLVHYAIRNKIVEA